MEELNSSGEQNLSEEIGLNGTSGINLDESGKHSMVNGLSNGYDKVKKEGDKHKSEYHSKEHKDRDKEKHRDSDRDKHRSKEGDKDKHREKHKDHKDRDREKDKHREKDKERDKSKHSSSSSKDKHSSSSSSKDKDKDRRDKDKDRERSKHHDDKDRKDKEHKSSSSSNKENSSSSKDKEHKSSSSSKHSSSSSAKPSSSSSSKDKEHRDKDKEKDKERDKDKSRDKDKERSKDKHSSSSSKDKERHSSDKHRSDKDKHSSSSSKDKDRHSSDKKDKHKDKDKEKEKSRDKEKEREKEVKTELPQVKEELPEVKVKEEDVSFQTSIKDESMDDDDEGKLMIKEEPTDDESKLDFTERSIDISAVKTEQEEAEEDDDELPMAERIAKMKRLLDSEDEDDVPLVARKKPKLEKKKESLKKRKKVESDYEEEDEEEFKPVKKKKKVIKVKKENKSVKKESVVESSPKKKKKKEEEEQEVWKWWEEEKKPDGVKWNFLEHKGPIFAPPYERLPDNVKFYYNDKEMKLSEATEEVATFYARMLDHDYTTKEAFNVNFMSDWRRVMNDKEKDKITNLSKCNFKHMHAYFLKKSEERKAMSKEEKKAIKEENEKLTKEYGFCMIDGHKEKIGNFKIEPPGLFRGRGEHPKMGKLKRRVEAEDIIINCSKGSKVPAPPPGHKWKEVRHDNSVTWLASWTENVQGQVKYIMLNPSSKLKGEKDWQKYETARKLAKSIDKIRDDYVADFKSKEMRIRQRAVAMYFIDKLALRAGNEKDEDQADTVGCCSLRVEHIQLHEKKDGKENVVVFDFLGKDSIRYYNEVPVEKRVFKNLVIFMENKKGEDDLFDRLNTAVLNKHLADLMEGLSAKVFRTYNASWTLQAQLKELTDPDSTVAEKLLSYNRANRAVAILCNHQRAVPKTHDKSMANLREKLANKRDAVSEAEKNYKHAKRDAKNGSAKERIQADKLKKTLDRLKEQLLKLELQETDREENKCIALGTSKLNYLDPRISVAWCKKFDIPIEKIYNKTQRDKFRWAIDMATADYVF